MPLSEGQKYCSFCEMPVDNNSNHANAQDNSQSIEHQMSQAPEEKTSGLGNFPKLLTFLFVLLLIFTTTLVLSQNATVRELLGLAIISLVGIIALFSIIMMSGVVYGSREKITRSPLSAMLISGAISFGAGLVFAIVVGVFYGLDSFTEVCSGVLVISMMLALVSFVFMQIKVQAAQNGRLEDFDKAFSSKDMSSTNVFIPILAPILQVEKASLPEDQQSPSLVPNKSDIKLITKILMISLAVIGVLCACLIAILYLLLWKS